MRRRLVLVPALLLAETVRLPQLLQTQQRPSPSALCWGWESRCAAVQQAPLHAPLLRLQRIRSAAPCQWPLKICSTELPDLRTTMCHPCFTLPCCCHQLHSTKPCAAWCPAHSSTWSSMKPPLVHCQLQCPLDSLPYFVPCCSAGREQQRGQQPGQQPGPLSHLGGPGSRCGHGAQQQAS
jgi:hypothetical protein